MYLVLHVLTTFISPTYRLLPNQFAYLNTVCAEVQEIWFCCPGSMIIQLIHLFNASHPKRHILENLQQFSLFILKFLCTRMDEGTGCAGSQLSQ